MARLSQARLQELNHALDERSPDDLLRWAADTFGSRLAVISAMQMSGSVVCHMASRLKLPVPVLFVDTGVNFQETLTTRDRVAAEYGLTVHTLHPEKTMEQQTAELGILYLTVEGQKQCCHMRKNEPLLTQKGKYDCLISSLRRADGGRRGHCPIIAVDPEMNTVRLNPLANLTDEQMAAYIAKHQVIVNPLHAQGFTTISCNRCTTPVMPGEPKRAGRWRHLGPWSQYCGINPSDMDESTSVSIDLPQDLVDRILGQKTDFMI